MTRIDEDWGYRIDVQNDGFDIWVGCGNYDGISEVTWYTRDEWNRPLTSQRSV